MKSDVLAAAVAFDWWPPNCSLQDFGLMLLFGFVQVSGQMTGSLPRLENRAEKRLQIVIWFPRFLLTSLQMAMRDSEISANIQNVAEYFVRDFAINHQGTALISIRTSQGFVSVALAIDFGVV